MKKHFILILSLLILVFITPAYAELVPGMPEYQRETYNHYQ